MLKRNPKVLVTGGAGFIGSHLVDRLLSLGYKVHILDDLSSGNNLNRKAEFHKGGTYNLPLVRRLFKKGFNLCFHLAANTNVPLSVSNPLLDFKTLQGSINIIDACARSGVPIIYLSSSFIYGNAKRPTKESEPFKISAPYGISKFTTEKYLEFYSEVYGLKYTIFRPATVYGPRQVKGAMADYIRQLKQGKQAVIYGHKTRDYLYISDLLDAIFLTFLRNDVFNVGTGKETSLLGLYYDIAYLLNKKNDPIIEKERPGEVKFQSLDCHKLRKLGWKPKINLVSGLELCLKELQK